VILSSSIIVLFPSVVISSSSEFVSISRKNYLLIVSGSFPMFFFQVLYQSSNFILYNIFLLGVQKVVSFRFHATEITIQILYIFPLFCSFKVLKFGLLKCYTIWRLMHIAYAKSVIFTMAITKEHIRFSIHFTFHLKKNAAKATACQ